MVAGVEKISEDGVLTAGVTKVSLVVSVLDGVENILGESVDVLDPKTDSGLANLNLGVATVVVVVLLD